MKRISFIDTEVSESDNKAHDLGAVKANYGKLHMRSLHLFFDKSLQKTNI